MKRLAVSLLASLLALFLVAPVLANDSMPAAPYANRQLSDPGQEAKAQALMETIRCLVCQSQSIADSDASIAGDMRSQIRERIAAGESPEAIRSWMIARYGDYVTYTPRVTSVTWPLFAAPLVLIALAGLILRARLLIGRRS